MNSSKKYFISVFIYCAECHAFLYHILIYSPRISLFFHFFCSHRMMFWSNIQFFALSIPLIDSLNINLPSGRYRDKLPESSLTCERKAKILWHLRDFFLERETCFAPWTLFYSKFPLKMRITSGPKIFPFRNFP